MSGRTLARGCPADRCLGQLREPRAEVVVGIGIVGGPGAAAVGQPAEMPRAVEAVGSGERVGRDEALPAAAEPPLRVTRRRDQDSRDQRARQRGSEPHRPPLRPLPPFDSSTMMLRRCSVMSRELARLLQDPDNRLEHLPVGAGQLLVFQRVVERQLQVGDARRLIERQQRPAVGQRHQANAGPPLERRRRTHRDDGVPAEDRQLGERARTLPRPPLHQLDDGLADVLMHRRRAPTAPTRAASG